jgi:hypothetical protein
MGACAGSGTLIEPPPKRPQQMPLITLRKSLVEKMHLPGGKPIAKNQAVKMSHDDYFRIFAEYRFWNSHRQRCDRLDVLLANFEL